jgi:hypothetical protein
MALRERDYRGTELNAGHLTGRGDRGEGVPTQGLSQPGGCDPRGGSLRDLVADRR